MLTKICEFSSKASTPFSHSACQQKASTMLTLSLLSILITKSCCWLNRYFSSEIEGLYVLTAVRFLSPQWWCFRSSFDTSIYIHHWMAEVVCLANGRSCFMAIHKWLIWLIHMTNMVISNNWQHFSVDILFLV